MAANRHQVSAIVKQTLVYLNLAFLSGLYILPFIWLLSSSLKSDAQIFTFPPVWIPSPVIWENYVRVFQEVPFALYFKNTGVLAAFSIVGAVLSSSLVAYSFAYLRWPGKNIMFIILLGTLMIPFPVTMIPLYLTFRTIGWLDTFLPLIVPTFLVLSPLGGAFYVFLLRQFFRTIPADLFEAARIDGASDFGIYSRIILPLSKPAIAVVGILQLLASWNDFIGPLIYLQSGKMYPLALGVHMVRQARGATDWNLLLSASSLMILPIVVLFFFAQRYFIEGVTMTGTKG